MDQIQLPKFISQKCLVAKVLASKNVKELSQMYDAQKNPSLEPRNLSEADSYIKQCSRTHEK